MSSDMDDRRVTLPRAVQLAGVTRRTLYYWMDAGRLPFTKQGESRMVRVSDLMALASTKGTHDGRG